MYSFLNANEAREKLHHLIDEVSENHAPILIAGKRHNAVLLSEEDWNAIQETLFLVSVPGLSESIKHGMNTPLTDCDKNLDEEAK